jgi:hypothetical protein
MLFIDANFFEDGGMSRKYYVTIAKNMNNSGDSFETFKLRNLKSSLMIKRVAEKLSEIEMPRMYV